MTHSHLSNRHIGHRIRVARIDIGLSLDAMAERTGICTQQLESFERDDDMITAVELLAIASICRLPIEYFVRTDLPLDGFDKWRLWDSFQKLEPAERYRVQELIDSLNGGEPVV